MKMEKCIQCNKEEKLKDNICKSCRKRNSNKKYYENNKKRISVCNKEYRKKNRKNILEGHLDWRKRNRQRERDRGKIYRKENPEIERSRVKRYGEKYPEFTKEYHDKIHFGGLKKEVLKRDGYKCVDCGLTQEEHLRIHKCDLIVHHIDGVGWNAENPNNIKKNLKTVCKRCHGKIHGGRPKKNSS